MKKIIRMVDRAALTQHEGFFTSVLGDRGAVVVSIIATSLLPFSLSFLIWVGLALMFGWGGLAADEFNLPTSLSYLLSGILVLVGIFGMWLELHKMTKNPVVRGAGKSMSPRKDKQVDR